MLRRISFPYDRGKASLVVRWLLGRHSGIMDRPKLVALVFLADRRHLERYGKPIVGGPYRAMQDGPVASELLVDLKSEYIEKALWCQWRGSRMIAMLDMEYEGALSESVHETLDETDREFGQYAFQQLQGFTHELRAWKKNYPDPQAVTSRPLPYEDFFLDLADDSMLQEISVQQGVSPRTR